MEVGIRGLILHKDDSDLLRLASIPDPRYPGSFVVKPYIGGEEILGHPSVSTERFAVDIDGLEAAVFAEHPQLAAFLKRVAVEPTVIEPAAPEPFQWAFRRPSLLLRQRICRQPKILALVRHTDTGALQFLPSCVIPD